ncbi:MULTISPECIES: formate dehydrogenase accessory sulfurtransferase FdhD [unclassified Aeromicrobium]|uniref:formate dehydrogenase accessory sulfurtransferase FdhD n=1 Tax=unclassified Aeromicrobium TaxID=2633570 RepID=UPI0006F36B83|nr:MULTISPECIES: formate dehydrogenase accessory sulfurtransferase FdhD [unclassified Aeromicrobium]KQO41764.1 formate dehydrogenase family accessory protein FdhD [Aeromicrobium sp. Leaf245]KQP27096.1 formate dehydrogenase family accessory protein FdhD [Aeromicrobium sp. Leaf272]KQP77117.1 formate dehydrogenase family accessory protein FdhD [Aeromicrobium sp. Leaf289]KQP81150.1 formate dehydrogenase family accessory protein FdhD [Aeromicrobium sp. Leaf291]
MTKPVQRRRILRVEVGVGATPRHDSLAAEEPLEIRVGGTSFAVTMRTPGHDFDLVAGFLVSEGVVTSPADLRTMIYCAPDLDENTYNVIDVGVTGAGGVVAASRERNVYTSSSCGVCGLASIDAVATTSAFDVSADAVRVEAKVLGALPDLLRDQQAVFERTGGLHAAGLFSSTGEALAVREDVGRHNAVDKVVGQALREDRLPLTGSVLQVSGRASFELVQKAAMAGVPVLAAVSAPSSLAVDLADRLGVTLVGFSRGTTFNVYTHPERVVVD